MAVQNIVVGPRPARRRPSPGGSARFLSMRRNLAVSAGAGCLDVLSSTSRAVLRRPVEMRGRARRSRSAPSKVYDRAAARALGQLQRPRMRRCSAWAARACWCLAAMPNHRHKEAWPEQGSSRRRHIAKTEPKTHSPAAAAAHRRQRHQSPFSCYFRCSRSSCSRLWFHCD